MRGRSSGAATSKMDYSDYSQRVEAVNYYHKVLHRGCCSSPRSASGSFHRTGCFAFLR